MRCVHINTENGWLASAFKLASIHEIERTNRVYQAKQSPNRVIIYSELVEICRGDITHNSQLHQEYLSALKQWKESMEEFLVKTD